MKGSKYDIPYNEEEILPNKLGLKTVKEIEKAELEGFLYAYHILFEELSDNTDFNLSYLFRIHKLAFSKLYTFAGETRTVNISKGGFMFPAAKFLDTSLKEFEEKLLVKLPATYQTKEQLIKNIARVHGELLFIHPFREGNGRTARLLANLMSAKGGYGLLDLENFRKEKFDQYVKAIQAVASQNYIPMEEVISSLL
jgi:cell filamentation protein